MILRRLLYLLPLMALAGLAAWIADQPGSLRFTWLGYEITAPAPLALGLLALLGLGLFMLSWVLAWAAALPQRRQLKRQARGQAAFAAGMVAVAAGEPERAAKLAKKAAGYLEDQTLARLLEAHTAQLRGDAEQGRTAFTALAADPATAFLGLRGLLADARQRGDRDQALLLARRASALRPASPVAAEAELRLLLEAGNWPAARERLELAVARKAVTKPAAALLRAKLDLADAAEAAATGAPLEARRKAEKLAKLLPDHPGRSALLARAADTMPARQQAQEVLRALWPQQASPALAQLWLELEQAAGREPAVALQRAQALTNANPEAPASRLLLAEAALAARDYGLARQKLAPFPPEDAWSAPLRARLAAESEGDEAAADRWRSIAAGRPEAWRCEACGAGHAAWAMRCAPCGGFDSIRPASLLPGLPPSGAPPILLAAPKA
ncbi:heme biosynthesis HemY N-terminal domain-containing protein [Ferrovibrio sp.]|uniref:heme biosynthesis HemY N-terminal domain-containing protein n=1 Tax=Ferrovibrio sp. TaxID=1917215 RepID=UPI001B4DAB77|nr:heme biosynthesis HemY N-terminal domain-containing protein [Ferrovibrio sp.]MBP7062651.1 hypothetical protein [Ferrovibrio sp.]